MSGAVIGSCDELSCDEWMVRSGAVIGSCDELSEVRFDGSGGNGKRRDPSEKHEPHTVMWGKTDGYGALLDVQMSFCAAGGRDCAPLQK